jgi:hypothetical protein
MFQPHIGHHQATFIIRDTTALYTSSSVPLGTTLFLLLISFLGYIHRIFLAAISVFFMLFIFVVYALVLSFLVQGMNIY